MRAVILAGGKGTRLGPYTVTFPKPLVPVADMPILEIVIRQLKASGFRRITMAVGYLAELLMAYFDNGSKWGLDIDYSREDQPLGTVGPLCLIDDLPDTFLVMNGDVLTTLSFQDVWNAHIESGAELTVACHEMNVKVDLGVIEIDSHHTVTDYDEKPTLNYIASMGVYVFSKSALDVVEAGEYMDFPSVVLKLLQQQRTVKAYQPECRWLDIGRPEDYARATETFETRRHEFLPGNHDKGEGGEKA